MTDTYDTLYSWNSVRDNYLVKLAKDKVNLTHLNVQSEMAMTLVQVYI